MSVDIVAEAYDQVAKEKAKFKPTTVEKLLDLEFDLGTLLAIDTNEISTKELRYITVIFIVFIFEYS